VIDDADGDHNNKSIRNNNGYASLQNNKDSNKSKIKNNSRKNVKDNDNTNKTNKRISNGIRIGGIVKNSTEKFSFIGAIEAAWSALTFSWIRPLLTIGMYVSTMSAYVGVVIISLGTYVI
jgi:hypothetical protein